MTVQHFWYIFLFNVSFDAMLFWKLSTEGSQRDKNVNCFSEQTFLKENLYSGSSHLLFTTDIVILLKYYKLF